MRRSRLVAGGAVALLVCVLAAVRVFLPTDTLDRSHEPYPEPVAADGKVYGELMRAPLLVGTRLRVYGAVNRVWVDGPVNAKMPTSALWAFRRWPAQLVGVVADQRMVVSKWSDGQLVALEPFTGRIAWRAYGGKGATSYQGRRTGATTVYEPPDLYSTSGSDGQLVIVSGATDGMLTALDGATGAVLWRRPASAASGCRGDYTGPRLVVILNRCGGPSTVDIYDAWSGKPVSARPGALDPAALDPATLRPVGCAVGHSGCTGLAAPGGGWLIRPDGGFTAAPGLSGADSWLVGRVVVGPAPAGGIQAHDAVTDAPMWSWPVPDPAADSHASFDQGVRVVAVEPGLVHVITPDRDLVNLDPATGLARSGFAAHIIGEDKPWRSGYVYATHGYVVVERLLPQGTANQKDSQYYYPFPTLLLMGS